MKNNFDSVFDEQAKNSRNNPVNREKITLRNGNAAFDLNTLPLCGAKTRAGTPCKRYARANGRCKLHGGLSTGPKTTKGKENHRQAVTKHGTYSAQYKEDMQLIKAIKELFYEEDLYD